MQLTEKSCGWNIANSVTPDQETVNSELFVRILLSRISLKRHICHVKNSRFVHDLPTSVNISDFTIS